MPRLKTKQEIENMREGGKILSQILKELVKISKPGVSTNQIDKLARELILKFGVKSSFLGYQDYPAVVCTSINNEAVHAIPSNRELKEGDLFKIDFGVIHKDLHTDAAVTVLITDQLTKVREKEYAEKRKLINITRQALYDGIAKAKPGEHLGDISAAVQKTVEDGGFTIIKELGGHGIGEKLHEDPFVSNYGQAHTGEKLEPGMVIAIEPITSTGAWKIKDSHDGHGYLTKDGSLSAHFEHTVVITEKGPMVLTE